MQSLTRMMELHQIRHWICRGSLCASELLVTVGRGIGCRMYVTRAGRDGCAGTSKSLEMIAEACSKDHLIRAAAFLLLPHHMIFNNAKHNNEE